MRFPKSLIYIYTYVGVLLFNIVIILEKEKAIAIATYICTSSVIVLDLSNVKV